MADDLSLEPIVHVEVAALLCTCGTSIPGAIAAFRRAREGAE
ncbi:hypothetical protein [Rhodovulum sp. BSW8]|nr:hypothetical protein [Rhodovulum sp. BSW8]